MQYPLSPEQGPLKVLLKKGEFVDAARGGRVVPFKIYHPGDYEGPKLPVIVWSHGFGGNRDGASFISRYLTSYGYVIVHITHIGTDSSLWEGQPGHPWDILRKVSVSRETTLERFMDVPFTLDQLPLWAERNPDVGAIMDLKTIGMCGHSFGAMTSQVMAGQMFPNEYGELTSYAEPRFKAGILYSPVPIRHLVREEPEPHIYGPITLPLMHMTGTQDDSPIENFGYEHRLKVFNYSGSKEKYLQILKGGDHMVYNGTRGQLGVNPYREKHEEQIKVLARAFWEVYLKDNEKAKAWLVEGGAQTYMDGFGEFTAALGS